MTTIYGTPDPYTTSEAHATDAELEAALENNAGTVLARVETNAATTGISTNYVDHSTLTITFTVEDRPVEVIAHLPYVLPSAATTLVVAIRDAADVEKSTAADQRATAIFFAPITVKEYITTPGTYTRKVSAKRFGGSGTISIGTAGSNYLASIEAIVR